MKKSRLKCASCHAAAPPFYPGWSNLETQVTFDEDAESALQMQMQMQNRNWSIRLNVSGIQENDLDAIQE